MPRGDMDGTVLFTDPSRLLCCELQFGEIPGSEDPLLRRSDTMEGAIYSLPADWKKGDVVPTVCLPLYAYAPSPQGRVKVVPIKPW